MGKAKKKYSAPRPQPTGLPSVAQCESELEMEGNPDSSSSTLQTLIEKLQSPNEENRESACTTIANFVSNPEASKGLLKLNVVRILGPLVLDPSWEIRHRSLGALRNLSVDGGEEVCAEMIRKDILTPVLALIKQIPNSDVFGSKFSERFKQSIFEAYTHAFYLLLYLCESSSIAVSQFNREALQSTMCLLLNSDEVPTDLKIAVCEFLHMVSEDNTEVSTLELVTCIQRLVSLPLISPEYMVMVMLAAGVLVNLEDSNLTTGGTDQLIAMVTRVSEVLEVNAEVMMAKHGANGALAGHPQGDDSNTQNTTEEEEGLSKKFSDTETVLKAQKIALEIVANLCCSDDDGWEDMNSSEGSSDDAMEVAMEGEATLPADDMSQGSSLSKEIFAIFSKFDIVSKVLIKAQAVSLEKPKLEESQEQYQRIVNRFQETQTHALLCLNNLVGSLDIEALGGGDRLYTVWQGLTQMSATTSCIEHQGILEAVTSAMRAVIEKLANVQTEKFESVTPSELQFVYEMSTKCQWSEVRVNSLRIISTIGIILAKQVSPNPLLKEIGMSLLEIVSKDTDLWVVGEALDAIFDVFSEDHVDSVVKEIGLVEKLKVVAPVLKQKMQDNKQLLGDHYPVLTMARSNLIRFIKYKSAR
ncbi:HEAT repeat-containing protein 3-like [Dreissena polymorpha]|uniref:SYO1-like TPR repeats domain-containing protein n=1 Tax=Dreissena polymorpha TaxID=45954 RepID=A0A9D4IKE0_DREPO|nr:HEAT repeat-containing protein 3-like [Dreissena polymorpha]KAH3775852.1 hypothetical protein DPMN_177261 [Dreissena polymorpha]